jgi:hypothetical protein
MNMYCILFFFFELGLLSEGAGPHVGHYSLCTLPLRPLFALRQYLPGQLVRPSGRTPGARSRIVYLYDYG